MIALGFCWSTISLDLSSTALSISGMTFSFSISLSLDLCLWSLVPPVWVDICLNLDCYWALLSLGYSCSNHLHTEAPSSASVPSRRPKQYMSFDMSPVDVIAWTHWHVSRMVDPLVFCWLFGSYIFWYICYCWWLIYMHVLHMDDSLVVMMHVSIFHCWFLLAVWFLYHLIYKLLLVDMKNRYIIWFGCLVDMKNR